MNITESYRYPGSAPFQDTVHDRLIFFGREEEGKLLFHMISSERLLVLFARSGIGKTSLVNAGLMKPLRDNNFIPISVRFNNTDESPIESIYSAMDSLKIEGKGFYFKGNKTSFWHFFKTSEFWSQDDKLMTPLIILDQFEDFFIFHSKEKRGDFIEQLAGLLGDKPPKEVTELLKTGKSSLNTDSPEVKVLIAIREDYLASMDEMSIKIPLILHSRFRLLPLSREQAEISIINPGELEDSQIKSNPLIFDQKATTSILDFLCKRHERGQTYIGDEVEPFQLQLLCNYIDKKTESDREKREVDSESLVGENGEKRMEKILEGFYERQLKSRGGIWKRRRLSRLCEKGLINTTNQRLSLEVGEISRIYGIQKKELEELVNARLLRADHRVGSVYYELSHDTIVKPIKAHQNKHFIQNFKYGSVMALVIIIILTGVLFKYNKSYDSLLSDNLISLGDKNLERGEFKEAEENYLKAFNLYSNKREIYNKLITLYELEEKEDRAFGIYMKLEAALREEVQNAPNNIDIYYQLGTVLFKLRKYTDAIDVYDKIIEFDSDNENAYLEKGIIYFTLEKYDEAIREYSKAIEINPNNEIAYSKLSDSFFLLGNIEDGLEQALKVSEFESQRNVLSDAAYEMGRLADELEYSLNSKSTTR